MSGFIVLRVSSELRKETLTLQSSPCSETAVWHSPSAPGEPLPLWRPVHPVQSCASPSWSRNQTAHPGCQSAPGSLSGSPTNIWYFPILYYYRDNKHADTCLELNYVYDPIEGPAIVYLKLYTLSLQRLSS